MPTLYSITDDFLDKLEKKKDFLKATKDLKKQFVKAKAETYVKDSVEQIHDILQESTERKEDPAIVRKKIEKLLKDEDFKKGASVIEIPKDAALKTKWTLKNKDQMKFFLENKKGLMELKRYTIDSVKEFPRVIDAEKNIVEESKQVRVIEAVFNKEKFKGNLDQLTFSDLLDPKNWLEEDREDKKEVVEYHKTIDNLKDLFPIKDIPILEGRVILSNKRKAIDITELARQTSKVTYKNLLKTREKREKIRRRLK